MTNDKPAARELKSLLLQMKLDPEYEVRVAAEEAILNEFRALKEQLEEEKKHTIRLAAEISNLDYRHEKKESELAAKIKECDELRGEIANSNKFEAEGKPITCKVCLRYLKKENPNDQRNVTARGESGATSGPG